MDSAEKMACDIAMKLNGGEWSDGKWYSEGHRKGWIDAVKPYADEIERLKGASRAFAEQVTNDYKEIKRLREALKIISCKCKSNCGKDEGNCLYWVARSALQQKDTE